MSLKETLSEKNQPLLLFLNNAMKIKEKIIHFTLVISIVPFLLYPMQLWFKPEIVILYFLFILLINYLLVTTTKK